MDIVFRTSGYRPVLYPKYINLQWIRRFYSVGEFSIQIKAEDYKKVSDWHYPMATYVTSPDRPETGIIQKVEYVDGADGATVQLSGYFMEYLLFKSVIYPRYGPANKTLTDWVHTLIHDYDTTHRIDRYRVDGRGGFNTYNQYVRRQFTGETIGEAIYSILGSESVSIILVPDTYSLNPQATVWRLNAIPTLFRGLDRRPRQSENSWAIFSKKFKNIGNLRVTIDDSGWKNGYIVVGNGSYEDGNQIMVENCSSSDPRYLYVDRTHMMFDSSLQTQTEYERMLRNEGLAELRKYPKIENVEFDVIQRKGMEYLVDYDLGDMCQVEIEDMGLFYEAKITEVTETFKGGQHIVALGFGDKVPTVYDKATRR